MTVYMILFLWAAQAFIEYKLIDAAPQFIKTIFHHKIGGIVLSIAIGFAVAFALGIPNGFIVGAANFLGLATNNLTYPAIKRGSRAITSVRSGIGDFKESHPQTVKNLAAGGPAVLKFIVFLVCCVGFVIRCFVWLIHFPGTVKARFSHSS